MNTRLEKPGGGNAGTFVADLLPSTAPDPEPARAVRFFRAFLFHWLMPRRWGPDLAAGTFRRALAAHLVSLLLGAAVFTAFPGLEWAARRNLVGGLHDLRLNAANLVLEMAAMSAGAAFQWVMPILVIGSIPLLQLGLLALATLLMPVCAGGDCASSVWKRSVNNVYWATTVIVPLSVIISVSDAIGLTDARNDTVALSAGIAAIIVLPVLILRPLLTGATRYVGPPDGPAFSPRKPVCDQCGYALIKLPPGGNCPECGLSVAESLPGGRRQPTVWQAEHLTRRGCLDLLRLQRTVLRSDRLFETLPVHSGMAAARHFWWGTYLLMLLAAFVFLKTVDVISDRMGSWAPLFLAGPAVVLIVGPPILFGALMFIGCLAAQFRYGIRDYRVSAIACYYGSPYLWPAIGCFTLGSVLLMGPSQQRLESVAVYLTESGWLLRAAHLTYLLLFGLGVYTVVFAIQRLGRALHLVRFANV